MWKKPVQSEDVMNDEELRIERLISRRLDGEISPEESLELDKLLLREPALREQLEASREIDALAAAVLADELADDAPASWPHMRTVATSRSRWAGLRRAGMVAAAACLVLWALWPTLVPPQADTNTPINRAIGPAPQIMVNAPQAQDRVELEYIGVMSDDPDKIYWLEIKRSEKQPVQPTQGTTLPRSGGEL